MNVFIETYGCESNVSTTETIAGLLTDAGHKIVPPDSADIVIINTCALQTVTENKILRRLSELNQQRKKTLVIGCLAEVLKEKIEEVAPYASIAAISSVGHIADIVEKMGANTRVMRFKDNPLKLIDLPKVKVNPFVAIIPIADGCLENCSFCIDRITRGTLISGEPDHIIREAQKAIAYGAKEIHLAAQDTAAYGLDIGVRLPALLRKLSTLPGDFKIKLGPMNPSNVIPILSDLVLAYNHPKIYRYLDMPLQSGSDKILSKMSRKYTKEQYKNIIAAFRKSYTNIAISTDVLIGFPGETDADFGETISVLNDVKPDNVNIYRFGARPLTKAAAMHEPMPSWKMKNRADEAKAAALKYADLRNENWLGWKGNVLVTEFDESTPIGRNYAYKPVMLSCNAKLGDVVSADIVKARSDYLIAR